MAPQTILAKQAALLARNVKRVATRNRSTNVHSMDSSELFKTNDRLVETQDFSLH